MGASGTAVVAGMAVVGTCVATAVHYRSGQLAASSSGGGSSGGGGSSSGGGEGSGVLRRCRRCGASLGRDCFTPKQWARTDPNKRTCNSCCAALDAERIAREQATGTTPPPRAWSGRHNKPSRGKAPRHSFADKQPIIVAENIDDYRAAIRTHVRETDVVLEIGCHQGSSTVLMDNVGLRAVGVDKGQHVLAEGKRLHPQLSLYDIDASDIAALKRLHDGDISSFSCAAAIDAEDDAGGDDFMGGQAESSSVASSTSAAAGRARAGGQEQRRQQQQQQQEQQQQQQQQEQHEQLGGPFDVVFIDIGGGSVSSVASVWSLIEAYGRIISPRVFVVKSFKLAELMHRCCSCQPGHAVGGPLSS
jgi:hypothetical protein